MSLISDDAFLKVLKLHIYIWFLYIFPSTKLVKERLEAFLKEAQSLKPDPQHVKEVCFLCVQCMEVSVRFNHLERGAILLTRFYLNSGQNPKKKNSKKIQFFFSKCSERSKLLGNRCSRELSLIYNSIGFVRRLNVRGKKKITKKGLKRSLCSFCWMVIVQQNSQIMPSPSPH